MQKQRSHLLIILFLTTGFYSVFGVGAEASPFALFKLNGSETDCVVIRLSENGHAPYGRNTIGEQGGAVLSDEEAQAAYQCAQNEMFAAYSQSSHQVAQSYQNWQKFSTMPYRSATHGTRYVSNYANEIAAKQYGEYEKAGKFPIGSILVKDSFVVNATGRVIFGALSLMEKMPTGFNQDNGDWRYTLILPDGRQFGSTGDDSTFKVEFCQSCHKAVHDSQDSLFFLPKAYRVE